LENLRVFLDCNPQNSGDVQKFLCLFDYFKSKFQPFLYCDDQIEYLISASVKNEFI
jgi:hypothetical protein